MNEPNIKQIAQLLENADEDGTPLWTDEETKTAYEQLRLLSLHWYRSEYPTKFAQQQTSLDNA